MELSTTQYLWNQKTTTSLKLKPIFISSKKIKVNFQSVNTGWDAHLPLKTNWATLILRCVGLATPLQQQAWYLLSIAGTHLNTWVKKSNYG